MAVLAWDHTGMGARQHEGAPNFYRRYPQASRLGAMVGEVSSALDFVYCTTATGKADPHCSDGSDYHSYVLRMFC